MRALLLAMLLTAAPVASLAQAPPTPAPPPPADEHAGHWAHGAETNPQRAPELPPFIPALTDEDRRAAFPDVHGHAVHDRAINYFALFDQLEWQTGGGSRALNVDTTGWIGQDINRLWFRAEAASEGSDFAHAEAHLLYGRAIARWWDAVAGVRQDVGPGPDRTWAAVGVQGLAPYFFDIEATAYLGASGRTHFRIETEYDLLITNRLILQPLVEMEIYGTSDNARGVGAGLSEAELGFRLRYEFRREFAPYVGVTWDRKFFGTADLARADGERTSGTRLAIGVRVWM